MNSVPPNCIHQRYARDLEGLSTAGLRQQETERKKRKAARSKQRHEEEEVGIGSTLWAFRSPCPPQQQQCLTSDFEVRGLEGGSHWAWGRRSGR